MKTKSDTDWKHLESLADKDIDFSDIPELDEAFFKEAEWRPPIKQPITIRLDDECLSGSVAGDPVTRHVSISCYDGTWK